MQWGKLPHCRHNQLAAVIILRHYYREILTYLTGPRRPVVELPQLAFPEGEH
jgi:hypothetical protein